MQLEDHLIHAPIMNLINAVMRQLSLLEEYLERESKVLETPFLHFRKCKLSESKTEQNHVRKENKKDCFTS